MESIKLPSLFINTIFTSIDQTDFPDKIHNDSVSNALKKYNKYYIIYTLIL